MLQLKGNKIVYHDGVEYAEVVSADEEIVLKVTENPLQPSELSDLIEILQALDRQIYSQK